MARPMLVLLMLLTVIAPSGVSADDEDLTMEQEREQIGRNMEAERKGEQPSLNNSGVLSPAVQPSAPPTRPRAIRRDTERTPPAQAAPRAPKAPQPGQP